MNEAYAKAKREADRYIRKAVLHGEYPYIPALDDVIGEDSTGTRLRLGIMEIPLDLLAGTVTSGRQNVFAANFMPAAGVNTEFAAKWNSLYRYQEEQGIQDAVTVFEYKHRFYVQEGNKRVSVLKYLRMPVILADVTRIMPKEPDELYAEFLAFYKVSRLYEPYFSETGSYAKFAKLTGQDLEHEWSDETVRRIKGVYYRFQKAYQRRFDAEDEIPCGDVFLEYLSVYGFEAARTADSSTLDRGLVKLKGALIKDTRKTEIAAHPDEIRSDSVSEVVSDVVSDLKKALPFALPKRRLRVAFIYPSSASESAEVFDHELGRILLEKRLGDKVTTCTYEDCRDEKTLKEALTDATNTCDVILTVSPSHFADTYRFAVKNPGKRYLNCSRNMKRNVLPVYGVRMYEADFLLGALAAVFADSHRIAYLAEAPQPGSAAQINAFAIGASMVDPHAQVILSWKEYLDEDWQEQMKRLDISVFRDSAVPSIKDGSVRYGIYRLDENGPINLAVPVINWGNYYTKMIQPMTESLSGSKDKTLNYWWGMSADVLDVNVSGSLPYQSRKMIQLLKNGLTTERLDPFDGEIHSTERVIKGPYDPKLTTEEILSMNWLNDNVTGFLPQTEDTGL
ncbi:MAG: BMP family ABC transporter substrate-binding protein [Solobacterium sp.]|nr:BMP family ABC transporter substrate-binding protein [Solobacterium sp.]